MDYIFRTRFLPYVAAGLVLTAIVWAVTYRSISLEHEQTFMQSAQQAERLATVFEQHTLRTLHYSDSYLKLARREHIENGGVEAVRKMLEAVPLNKSIVSHITVIDETGTPLLVSGYKIKPGTTAKDRGYFQFQRDNPGDQIFVSLPREGRNTGKLLFRLVRRITMPDGRFGGVIFAALEANQITQFFSALNLGPKSSATLVGTDKKIRARSSYGRLGPGQDISGSRIWRELEQSPVGLYKQTSVVDDITRYYAYRMLADFPLIVAIGVSTEDIAQAVAQFKTPIFAIAVLMTIVVTILTVLICREILVSQRLRDGETRIRTIVDSILDGIITIDETGRIESFNSGAQRIFGYGRDEVLGRNASMLLAAPADSDHVGDVLRSFNSGEGAAAGQADRECRCRRKDRTEFPAELSISEMTIGGKRCFVGTVSDITDRQKLEEQLQQAQKMEAVGQLTGGMAHDFNNLLGVILGNLDLLKERLRGDEKLEGLVDSAIRGADRGAKLNSQLLAFSRQQPLSPEVIDLNKQIAGMVDMLRRVLGETIEVEVRSSRDIWSCEADSRQIESALLNLVLNARDAMPAGGRLTIETANVDLAGDNTAELVALEPGRYVTLAVADSGTGIAPEVLGRVFDPFFTTKDVGEGSGLGLSMVYGFAKQSGGDVTINSQAGHGTTVKLYLPRAQRAAAVSGDGAAGEAPEAHGETVLVVEDDPDLRTLAVSLLGDLGYRVLEASDGKSALATMAKPARIDLLLSDVVLPGGMGGPAVAEAAARHHPGIRVLYMSGYSAKEFAPGHRLDDGVLLLEKPFRKAVLAHKVREALEATA